MNDQELMRCLPEPAVASETDDETGQIILLKPRYGQGWFGRLLTRRLANPWVRVHLDELGTFIWQHADGEHTIGDIAAQMQTAFPDESKPDQRLLMFIRQLAGTGLLRIRAPAEP